MLQRLVDKGGRNWDQLLPYIFFVVREILEVSISFLLFKLLFKGRLCGWTVGRSERSLEGTGFPSRFVVEDVQSLQDQISRVSPIVCEHME